MSCHVSLLCVAFVASAAKSRADLGDEFKLRFDSFDEQQSRRGRGELSA